MWKLWSGKSSDFLLPKWWTALNWELSWLIFPEGLKAQLPLSLDSLQLLSSTVYWPLSDPILANTCHQPTHTHTHPLGDCMVVRIVFLIVVPLVESCPVFSHLLLSLGYQFWHQSLRVPFSLIHSFDKELLNFKFAFSSGIGMPHTPSSTSTSSLGSHCISASLSTILDHLSVLIFLYVFI